MLVYTAYKLQPHCSYINRANVSQASRGFVSDSWPFLSVAAVYSDSVSTAEIT